MSVPIIQDDRSGKKWNPQISCSLAGENGDKKRYYY
jgi:hypothetical protein